MNERLARVVEATNRNREAFERFCRSLSHEELERPIPESHWRVKDYIAHLASIDIWVGEWFDGMAEGRHAIPNRPDGRPFNIDTWNDERIEERSDAGVEELLGEAAETRARLLAIFPRFTDETLAARFDFRGREISFIEYLEAWTMHDPAHAMDMLKALPEKKQDPGVRAWIDEFRAEVQRQAALAERR